MVSDSYDKRLRQPNSDVEAEVVVTNAESAYNFFFLHSDDSEQNWSQKLWQGHNHMCRWVWAKTLRRTLTHLKNLLKHLTQTQPRLKRWRLDGDA